ncbi:hypothetical protein LAD54_27410 [Klebsiella pneumoniae]|nr:hypothetical protein [Klebsiella pneumoniae]
MCWKQPRNLPALDITSPISVSTPACLLTRRANFPGTLDDMSSSAG